MIVTNQFVFIHMHKTGGQSLNAIISEGITDHQHIGYHHPRHDVPPEAAELPVVGMVRNPWDWYVSWYGFNRRPKTHNLLFNVISDGGTGTFKSTVTNLIRLASDRPESKQHRDDLVRMLPDTIEGNQTVGLAKDSIRDLANSETGYYSWLFDRMLGDTSDGRTHVGRFENLQDDFLAIMKRLSVPETETLQTEFNKRARKNVSRHSHYSHYYDDELRDLVASNERGLIETFNYEFDSMKPSNVAYEFPGSLSTGARQGFHKLLGRESNYLPLHRGFDVTAVTNKIEKIPDLKWLEFGREKLFAQHKETQSVLLVHFEDLKHEKPEYHELFFDFENELKPIIDYIAAYYQNNGFIVRMMLAKLPAGGKIARHMDVGFSLQNTHRVHVPMITNDQVEFFVGGEKKNMRVGELWEINNALNHGVENRSDKDRVHLIVDWMPNFAGKTEAAALTEDLSDPAIPASDVSEILNSMVAQAHQLQRSGQTARAEPLYRQVLHMDDRHVIANNLLGLICLQTKRFDEAVTYIEKAIAEMPGDAQAHANLGLALIGLKQLEQAAEHFHESLKLAPDNPRVYSNLGSTYVSTGRIPDAIACFQQALAIQPAFPEVHLNLGSALLHLHRYAEAADSLRQCLALRPDFAEGRIKLEQALQGLKNQESAPR
jgi:tetratricopeptide (TPR) repeat protein